MCQRKISNVLALIGFTAASVVTGFAQSNASSGTFTIAAGNEASYATWEFAQQFDPSKHKVFVVTFDQPTRRQSCHIQSFTQDKLVCSRAIGGARTYVRKQVAALILPGDDELRRWVLLGLNGGLGTAIWGTVVLAAACPACAVGTGIAALICFSFAGAVGMTDNVPNRLLYLAPGHELSGKLGYVERVSS